MKKRRAPKLTHKPRKLHIKHHECKPTPMLPRQAYPYCGFCGRAMSKAKKVYFPTHIGEDGNLKVTVGRPRIQEPKPE